MMSHRDYLLLGAGAAGGLALADTILFLLFVWQWFRSRHSDSQNGSQEGDIMELLEQIDAKMKVIAWVNEHYEIKDLESLIGEAEKLWAWLIQED